MDIQEILKKHTDENGTIDYVAVNKFIENENSIQIGAVKSKALGKQAEELQALREENENLKQFNENFKGQEEYYKNKINELTELSGTSTKELGILKLKEKAKELNVNEQIIENFIQSGADISKIDLTPFHNTAKPSVKTGSNDDDDIDDENHNGTGEFTEEEIVARAMEMAEEE